MNAATLLTEALNGIPAAVRKTLYFVIAGLSGVALLWVGYYEFVGAVAPAGLAFAAEKVVPVLTVALGVVAGSNTVTKAQAEKIDQTAAGTATVEPEPFDPDEYDDPDADPDADDAELAADPFGHLDDAEPVGERAAQ
ncbi:hypothetical protein [Naumannella halotolerans]|uniref:Holin n=1 Tax=Naumannella halotolerans TaxID=993414 RepID=A0A4V3EN21_9ACTN|nr:hypothetical protein [Naumannella halotolerans]TDT31088.1 hypothetical protein CLV29_2501 [Naumannella halotolerans]